MSVQVKLGHLGDVRCTTVLPPKADVHRLPRANAAACPQLAKADFASSSQQAGENQRIAMLFFAS
jgi:hypothetical protein